jgi:hypothetical protein
MSASISALQKVLFPYAIGFTAVIFMPEKKFTYGAIQVQHLSRCFLKGMPL